MGLRPAFISFPVLSPVLVFVRHSGLYGNRRIICPPHPKPGGECEAEAFFSASLRRRCHHRRSPSCDRCHPRIAAEPIRLTCDCREQRAFVGRIVDDAIAGGENVQIMTREAVGVLRDGECPCG